MEKLAELYNLVSQQRFTWNRLSELYNEKEYYMTIGEDSFIGEGVKVKTLLILSIVEGEKTKFGGAVYNKFKKFVAVIETREGILYQEVKDKLQLI